MKTTTEQLNDLKEVKKLFYESYILQNRAKCLLSENFKIDNESKFLKNEFYQIYEINTSTNLYHSEVKTQILIDKINNTII
jgi:hypothetical protein